MIPISYGSLKVNGVFIRILRKSINHFMNSLKILIIFPQILGELINFHRVLQNHPVFSSKRRRSKEFIKVKNEHTFNI